MKNNAYILDKTKTALIILLIVSAVYLLTKAVFFEPGSMLDSVRNLFAAPVGELADTETAELSLPHALPAYIAVSTGDSLHYAEKYDNQEKEKLYSMFSASLGEALGSSGKPVQVSENDWRNALSENGVFLDYIYPQSLSGIAEWLGTDISPTLSSATSRRLCLSASALKMSLYYIDSETGNFYRCDTALSSSSTASKFTEYTMGSAYFAFENAELTDFDPYFLISGKSIALASVSGANPIRDDASNESFINSFGLNSRVSYEYSENDGSVVFVDGGKILRIFKNGSLSFSASDDGVSIPFSGPQLTLNDCIAKTNAIVQSTLGLLCGQAQVVLSKISGSSPDSCAISYSYIINGIPVELGSGAYAAEFQINKGRIVSSGMVFRQYTPSEQLLLPLPEKQAIAAAAAEKGGEPVLVYMDNSTALDAEWIIFNHKQEK